MESLMKAIRGLDITAVSDILHSGRIHNLDEKFISSTPLCEACKMNCKEIVDLLLSYGARVNIPSNHLNKRPLHLACDSAEVNVVRSLLDAGAEVNVQDDDGNTGLHLACTQSNVDVVRLLLESGADVSLEDVDNESPLLRACYSEQTELIEILLRYGASPNGTYLMTCILHDFDKGVSILYRALPDIKLRDVLKTVLKMKVFENRHNLMQQDIDPGEDDTGIFLPPLHIISANPVFCSYRVVLSILEVSPDVHVKDDAGYNSLQHACTCVNQDVIQVLLAYGANPDEDEWQPLWKYFPSLNDYNFNSYLMTLKLLSASGFHLDEESSMMFLQAVHSASEIPENQKALFKDFIIKCRSQPLTLKELSRVKIRRQVPVIIDKNVDKLNPLLPSNLLDYLRFEDLATPLQFD